MDGARRFLRSLKEQLQTLFSPAFSRPAAAFGSVASLPEHFPARPEARARSASGTSVGSNERSRRAILPRLSYIASRPGVGALGLVALFAASGWAGFVHGGGYRELLAQGGEPRDMIARALGFPINAVTISGENRLREGEILAAARIEPRNSLLFLDAAAVRDRLLALPLVKAARVLKFYPDRLVISIDEREPGALWQRDGKIAVVSADGMVIDELSDERFLGLPFVVGDGADKRLLQYLAIRNDMGDLASRVKAGVLIAGRRWSLTMTNGVEVKLPERDPGAAIGTLIRLQREARILDKDVTSIDLRLPDRVAVRLTEDAAAARAAASTRKIVKSGGHT
ncbi:MAG: cell division protein FtsQ/DivIB [Methylocystis sp.]